MHNEHEDKGLAGLQAKAAAYLKRIDREDNVFRLTARDSALLAVDMQNFVCRPEPGRVLPGMEEVIKNLNLMADFCHQHGIPVIWLRHCFTQKAPADDVGLYRLFHETPLAPGMFNSGEETEIYPEMHWEQVTDFVVTKNRYSAFTPGSSRLESLLGGLKRKLLIIGGVATNVCVESTARDAMQRGFQVTVLADATTAFDDLVHQISLLNIKLFFGDARPVNSVIQELADSL